MENAAEALTMAGSVLLFVLALSIALLLFTQARETIDILIRNTDREALIDSIDTSTEEGRILQGEFYYVANSTNPETIRNVGLETIIPSLYRAYTESYTVVFNFPDGYYLYQYKPENSINWQNICSVDNPDVDDANADTDDLLNGIVYGKDYCDPRIGNFVKGNRQLLDGHTSLYDYLQNKLNRGGHIEEQLGTYYIDDTYLGGADRDLTNAHPADHVTTVDEVNVNKTKRRIIIYTVFDN